jgi:DNA-3-methyladenine glycosylase I
MEEKTRCGWCLSSDLYKEYHDREWGVPVYDDPKLFEFLILETFQAGLSWITILNKRENFRKAFLKTKKRSMPFWGFSGARIWAISQYPLSIKY